MEKFFHLKENGTSVSTEFMAGLTTFFAMSYIIIVNPQAKRTFLFLLFLRPSLLVFWLSSSSCVEYF